MQRSTLHVYSKSDYLNFIPQCPKLDGARPGYIGMFKSQYQPYLLKVEGDGRPLLTDRSADERSALESLSSQLIRRIFDHTYAADIHLIEIGGTKKKPQWIGNNGNIKIKVRARFWGACLQDPLVLALLEATEYPWLWKSGNAVYLLS